MQPMTPSYGTARRPMDVEDFIDILRRHKSWIFGPAFAGVVFAVVAAFFWPDTYVSEAVIRVVPPQVPEKFVASNVNAQMAQRVAAMAQSITSRARLTDMINAHGLYPRKRNRVPMEDIIEEMRKAIVIGRPLAIKSTEDPTAASRAASAFRVEFSYDNRYLAQKVVQELVSRFIDESITTRASQSVQTTEFLKDKLDLAKKKLDDIENRLTEYKLKNAGRLPEELQTNLQQLRTLETQLSTVNSSINRVSQEKLVLESQLRSLKEQQQGAVSAASASAEAAKNERLMQTEKQILDLETALSGLREQYRDTHPDVKRVQAQLEVLKRSRDQMIKEDEKKLAQGQPKKRDAPRTREGAELEVSIQRVQALMQAKDLELDQYLKEQARIDKATKIFQSRIEASPLGERMYAELTRDYSLAKGEYEDLSTKSTQSAIATDLENRKQGETLELLDPPTLPEKPTEPKRWLIVSVGSSIGLLLGLFLAGGRELKDTSLKNLKDVRAYTGLTVLGSIPLLESDLVVRRKRRLTWLAWSSACIVGFVVMISSVYYYYAHNS